MLFARYDTLLARYDTLLAPYATFRTLLARFFGVVVRNGICNCLKNQYHNKNIKYFIRKNDYTVFPKTHASNICFQYL
jgi:hypothetical protein